VNTPAPYGNDKYKLWAVGLSTQQLTAAAAELVQRVEAVNRVVSSWDQDSVGEQLELF
jgi:hypothetical protein